MTRKEVTEQLVFDGLCSVNAEFIFKGLRLKLAVNLLNEGGGVYQFGE